MLHRRLGGADHAHTPDADERRPHVPARENHARIHPRRYPISFGCYTCSMARVRSAGKPLAGEVLIIHAGRHQLEAVIDSDVVPFRRIQPLPSSQGNVQRKHLGSVKRATWPSLPCPSAMAKLMYRIHHPSGGTRNEAGPRRRVKRPT